MDEAIKKSIEASITKLLHEFGGGLTTSAMLDAIDEAEAPLQVSTVLNDMARRGLVEQDKASKVWRWAADANGSASMPPPAAEKKLHETAEAILKELAEGFTLTAGELYARCDKWPAANVGYHIKALKKGGLIVQHKSGKGYQLPKDAATPARAKPPARRPNTALLPGAKREEPSPAAIPPAAAAATPAPVQDITLELTCPNGRLKIDGTPKLVFGFLEQLKELAA